MAEHNTATIEQKVITIEQEAPVFTQTPQRICGGIGEAREIHPQEKELYEKHRDIIESKVQTQFHVPKDFKLEPVKVQTQVVAGINHYFHVRLPNKEFARVRVLKPLPNHELEKADPATLVSVDSETIKE